ncbi:hypothetical protein PGTUg99_010129 [Puccinia graminis f. sp. tritici]|uniref:Uncharacterized protein n=1 Tax=Puccinia graminis f. sp. tritici TaxID=56615 RepID=A0A5B0S6L1_PUCGR|nr:hypothetical protein PGTUg99_010129 [Puccinia graminis f. sp. tritici]
MKPTKAAIPKPDYRDLRLGEEEAGGREEEDEEEEEEVFRPLSNKVSVFQLLAWFSNLALAGFRQAKLFSSAFFTSYSASTEAQHPPPLLNNTLKKESKLAF